MRIKPKQRLAALLAALCAAGSASQAATFTANFNDGATPPGVTLYDPAKIVATGGVGNSGYLSLTDALGSLNGTIIIDDFANGAVIGGFTARMKIQISGGGNQPADGFSFSFGADLPDGPIGEEGSGTGLRVVLDTYDNGAGEGPALDVFWNNIEVAHTKFDGVTVLTTPPINDPATGKPASLQTGTNFMDLVIDLHPNGTLDVSYKGITVYKDLVIPDYNPTAGRFGLGARTGGAVENHWVDDLSITTVAPITGKAAVKNPPVSITVNERSPASFSVVPDGAPPFAFQWSRNGTDIPEATSNILAVASAAMTDNGAKYKVKITNAGGSVESAEAVLTVTPDTAKPAITSVTGSGSFTEVNVTFSEAIDPVSGANKANYTLDGGLTVTSAEVVAPNRVKLTTAKQTAGATYKLTVNGVKDTAATANAIEASTVKSFAAFTFLRGGLKFEAFYDIAGTAVQGLLDDPKYLANNADVVGFVTQFTSRLIFTDAAHENYGGRISGFIVPPESAQYEFFLRSDDGGQLYLSTDDKPENATLIAEETGCCGAFEDPGMPETSVPQVLVAGKQYYIMALWKEGGGGDYCDIAWRKVGDPTLPRGLSYIPGSVLETLAPPGTFTPPTASFASPANDSSFEVGAPVTLTANAVADPTKTIAKVEFFELGKLVGTATASPYSIVVPGLSEDAHKFTVKVTDSAGIFTESAPITISIGGLRKKVTFLAIDTNTVWRYDRSGQDLGTEWRAKNYDDSKWPQGKALIADETTTTVEPIRTAISRLTDDGTYIKTFYFRAHFNFPGTVTPGVKLALRHVVDDGAIFYLNGVEIHRLGITANPVDATSDATSHENVYEGPFDISLASLVSGDNVLTAEVHQSGGSSSDMVFGAELVATIPAVTATILAIDDKTIWRYDRSGQDLGSDWRALGYDDSKWPQGKALIADETTTTVEPIRTAISRLTDDGTYIKTFYFRHVFNFDGEVATAKLKLRHVVDDGAIFYLNGVEINRLGITANPADATSDATSHENVYEGPFDIAIASLKVGPNILAAEVHQSGGSSSDMVFGAELVATYFGGSAPVDPTTVAPKFSSIKLQSGNLVITWTGTGTLQGADTVAGPWSNVANASSPFSVASPTASKFYRLRQ